MHTSCIYRTKLKLIIRKPCLRENALFDVVKGIRPVTNNGLVAFASFLGDLWGLLAFFNCWVVFLTATVATWTILSSHLH